MTRQFSIEKPEGGSLIKMWDSHHVDGDGNITGFESGAMQQLRNVASLPFIFKHVAAMPDAHQGYGASVGTVMATKGAIIPYAVGVDIGCGMMAVRLSALNEQLPDSLRDVRLAIEAAVPHGRTDHGGENDVGAWRDAPGHVTSTFLLNESKQARTLKDIADKAGDTKLSRQVNRAVTQLGTLGGGNHFIEVCTGEDGHLWVMLHSGSRGIGNAIGQHFIEKAKAEMKRYFISNLPDENLAYLVADTEPYDDYMAAVGWAQRYAMMNRELMMGAVIDTLLAMVDAGKFPPFHVTDMAVNCHHNYVEMENHYGQNVLVTRKGAVRARKGDLGIIPGSMGARSFIVRGLGSDDSFCSCSHGAGRVMSRGVASRTISLEDHTKAVAGVECRIDKDVLDESPAAYKDIDKVMAAQSDLVEVVTILKQVLCVKG